MGLRLLSLALICSCALVFAQEAEHTEEADCCAVAESAEAENTPTPATLDSTRLWCNEHNVFEDECYICHPEILTRTADRDPDRAWCTPHGVYEDECAICNPETASASAPERDPNRLWCNEHGLYEDECTICHPEIAAASPERDPNRLWCRAHGVYEDECVICHPETASVSGPQGPPDVLWCGEHDLAEQECGICHPELLATMSPGQGLKVRFESGESARKAGVRTNVPESRVVSGGGQVFARISYDRNALAVVTPLAGGVLGDIRVDVGDEVEAGQIIATINSRELASAKSALVMALAEKGLAERVYKRQKDLHAEDVATQQQLDEARAEYDARRSEVDRARQHLLNLGLTESEVDTVAQSGSASSVLPVRAPFVGTIVERTAVMGSAVETGDMLFEIADLSNMWLEISVPENQMGLFRPGMAVAAEFDAYPSQTFQGEITWTAHRVDAQTRMLEVRAELSNAERLLKHGMFGRVRVAPNSMSRLSVPEDAVQVIDGRTVVFARLADDLYETRLVKVGSTDEGWAAIDAGLSPHDEIAFAESYILKSELLKARLGAGCTEH